MSITNISKEVLVNLGGFEKLYRLDLGLSLENVSQDLGVSKSNLSENESRKRNLRPEVFFRFLETYQIQVDLADEWLIESLTLLDSWILGYLRNDNQLKKDSVSSFFKRYSQLWYSSGCLNTALLETLISVWDPSISITDKRKKLKRIQLFRHFFLPDYQAVIYLAWAVLSIDSYQSDKGIVYLRKALKIQEGNIFKDLKGAIYFHFGKLYTNAESFEKGAYYVEKAIDAFYQTGNFFRLNQAKNNLAVYEIYMQRFETAHRLLDEVIDSTRLFGKSALVVNPVANKILTLFLDEQYEKMLSYACTIGMESIPDNQTNNLCFIPCAYYLLNQEDKMLQSIQELETREVESEDRLLFSFLRAMQNKDKEKSLEIYNRYQAVCVRKYNWGMMMALNQMMRTFAAKISESRLELMLYHQKDQLLRHQTIMEIQPEKINCAI